MKNSLILKVFVLLPVLLFVDYILMVIIGCATCLFGFGDGFYCGPYCIFGKIILGLSAAFFIFIIFPDLKNIIKKKNVAA
jgi:hypothetical protein